jgi:hypothetical protein
MGNQTKVLTGVVFLAATLAAGSSRAVSTLDGWPSRTVYLSNDAPFVVFGVTPTQVDRRAAQIQLSFIATDRLSTVEVYTFVRDTPGDRVLLRSQATCGPREIGSWDCVVPVAGPLNELQGPQGELGLRIEAHGDPRKPSEHSTVLVTLPVGKVDGRATRKSKPAAPPMP